MGGNISLSFDKFMKNPNDIGYSKFGNNNGNGAVMRLAAVPILF